MADNHIYEVSLRRTTVYAQPSTFSAVLCHLGRVQRFVGRVVRTSWVERAAGGYVRLLAVRDLGVAAMNDAAWMAFLDSVTPTQKAHYQAIMARISHILNNDRIITIEDVQHLEDNDANQQRHIEAEDVRQNETDARLDAEEAHGERTDDRLDALEAHESGE